MYKIFAALEKIKRDHIIVYPSKKNEDGSLYKETEFEEEFNIIEQSLLELKAIKEAKPSEAFKCLHILAKQIELDENTDFWEIKNAHKTVEQYILKAEKLEKVWKIVKEKCLHTDNLNYVAVCINYDMYKAKMSEKYDTKVVKTDWNDKYLLDYLKLLTQQEFGLLKEMAEND